MLAAWGCRPLTLLFGPLQSKSPFPSLIPLPHSQKKSFTPLALQLVQRRSSHLILWYLLPLSSVVHSIAIIVVKGGPSLPESRYGHMISTAQLAFFSPLSPTFVCVTYYSGKHKTYFAMCLFPSWLVLPWEYEIDGSLLTYDTQSSNSAIWDAELHFPPSLPFCWDQ